MAFTKNTKDPFSTPVGHLIEINTVGTVKDEDWGQFMNICDKINSSAEGPKDAVKALKKRISKNYNQKQVKLSLSLLEMCMQNCNANFQTLVLKKDFCKDVLVKLLNPKYNLPIDMQYRILRFIMTWATSPSRGDVDQVEVKELYLEMIKKGIQFPSLNPSEDEIRESHRTGASQSSDISSSKPFSEATGQNLTPEQIGKLYSELDMVRMNMKVMSAILLENYPGSEIPGDMELLEELQKTCQEMQARILKLLETVQNEEVIIELVHVNDDLNNLFLRYQRFSRTRGSQSLDNIRREDNSMSNNNDPSAPSSELIELDLKPINHYANGHPPPTTAASAAASAITPRLVHSSDPGSAQQSNFIYPQRDLLELREAVNMPFTLGGQIQVPSIPPRPLYDNAPYPSTLFQPRAIIAGVPMQTPSLPVIQSSTPFLPATQSSTPFLPATQSSTPFLPATQPSIPFLPPMYSSTPLLPPVANSAPLIPTVSPLLPAVPMLSPAVLPLTSKASNTAAPISDDGNNNGLPNYYELIEFDPLADSNGAEAVYEEIDTAEWKAKKAATEC